MQSLVKQARTLAPTEGTFTATGTGFASNPTCTARYVTVGKLVCLFLDTLSGSSNATTFTVTGLPAAMQPTRTSYGYAYGDDNGTATRVLVRLNAGSGTLDLFPADGIAGWTAAGTKRLQACWLVYALL